MWWSQNDPFHSMQIKKRKTTILVKEVYVYMDNEHCADDVDAAQRYMRLK